MYVLTDIEITILQLRCGLNYYSRFRHFKHVWLFENEASSSTPLMYPT
jgi:hypothetical protein